MCRLAPTHPTLACLAAQRNAALQRLTVTVSSCLPCVRACLLCGTAMVTRAKEERAAETHMQTEAMLQRLESALCDKLQVGTANASAVAALASP